MTEEVKRNESTEIRVVRLEERMNHLSGEVGEMKTWMQRIDEKLSAIRDSNPIQDFLKKNWHFVVGIVLLVMSGNSAVIVKILEQYIQTQI